MLSALPPKLSELETSLVVNGSILIGFVLMLAASFWMAMIAGKARLTVWQATTRLSVVMPPLLSAGLNLLLFTRLGAWGQGASVIAIVIVILVLSIPVLVYWGARREAEDKSKMPLLNVFERWDRLN